MTSLHVKISIFLDKRKPNISSIFISYNIVIIPIPVFPGAGAGGERRKALGTRLVYTVFFSFLPSLHSLLPSLPPLPYLPPFSLTPSLPSLLPSSLTYHPPYPSLLPHLPSSLTPFSLLPSFLPPLPPSRTSLLPSSLTSSLTPSLLPSFLTPSFLPPFPPSLSLHQQPPLTYPMMTITKSRKFHVFLK